MTEIKKTKQYDLEDRTAKFSEELIREIKQIKITPINKSIISQIIRSGTSVGANYCEANNASSKSDFRNKIYLCKKEINETKYWLRILSNTDSEFKENARKIWQEAQELNMIFQAIVNKINNKK
jgi:four helix bundle protein